MFLFITVLKVVFPIFFLGSIGFIWAKLNIDYPIKFVTQLFMNVSLPCLVFISLTNISSFKPRKDTILSILWIDNDFPRTFSAKLILANDFIFE